MRKQLVFTKPHVMGILNVTPDSFSDGGQFNDHDAGFKRVNQLIAEGADSIDIGGESTRPGATPISTQEELDRVLSFVEYTAQHHDTFISVDTSNPVVMREAVDAGAHMINDVRALTQEGALETAAQLGVWVCLMHMQQSPERMQVAPQYEDVVREVKQFLAQRVAAATAAGIDAEKIILDPGFGFGKTLGHNATLLDNLTAFKTQGFPILVGLSRKSMIEKALGLPVEQRLIPSVALAVMAYERGAAIVRTHDVLATRQALDMVYAIGLTKEKT